MNKDIITTTAREVVAARPESRSTEVAVPAHLNGDLAIMRYLQSPGTIQFPVSLEAEGDDLGLTRHNTLRSRALLAVYDRLDLIAAKMIASDPELRRQFIEEDSVRLSEFGVSYTHAFEVTRITSASERSVMYIAKRTDGGVEDAGFMVICNEGKTAAIRIEDDQLLDENDPRFEAELNRIKKFTDVLAVKNVVPMKDELEVHKERPTGPSFKEKMSEQYTKENSKVHKMGERIRNLGRTALHYGRPLVMSRETKLGGETVNGKWCVSKRKLAILAFVLPIPGAADITPFVPIPRSLPLEIAGEVYSAVDYKMSADDRATEAAARKIDAYDDQNLDIRGATVLGNEAQAIDVVNIDGDVARQAPALELNVYSEDRPTIDGVSPRLIKTTGILSSRQCIFVPVGGLGSGREIALAAASSEDASGLSAKAENNGMTICNDGDTANQLSGRSFYADTVEEK